MTIDKSAKEVLSTFDVIKIKVNELIINGVDNFNRDNFVDLNELMDKLKSLRLNFIVNLLAKFSVSLKEKNKSEIAKNALRIISTTRMFESIMNIELIKKDLINYMGRENAEGSNQ
ncbi:MAG TPA: hypothetical protein VGB37_05875 [Candidatus Lokiarchaeia archaeon]